MTNVQLATRLLTAPRRFFAELAESPRFALPMWVIVLTSCGLIFWYYQIVDLEWLVDQQLSSTPQGRSMTDAQREQAGRFMTRGIFTWGSAVSAFALIFVIRLLEALYYKTICDSAGNRRGYRRWFALSWWTSTPALLGLIPAVLTLAFSSTNQIDAAMLQPLSVNEVFLHRKLGDPGYSVFSQISLLMVPNLLLTMFGIRCWTGRSWLYSAIVAFAVPVLFIGALVALLVRA